MDTKAPRDPVQLHVEAFVRDSFIYVSRDNRGVVIIFDSESQRSVDVRSRFQIIFFD